MQEINSQRYEDSFDPWNISSCLFIKKLSIEAGMVVAEFGFQEKSMTSVR
jgi:hypothetical protein